MNNSGSKPARDTSNSSVSSTRSSNGNSNGTVFYNNRHYTANSNFGGYVQHPQHDSAMFHSTNQQPYQSNAGSSRDNRDTFITYSTNGTSQYSHQRPPPGPLNNQRQGNKVFRNHGTNKPKRKSGKRDNSQNRGGSSAR